MITDATTAPPAAPDLEDGVEVEVVVTNDGTLALIWPDGRSVEVPLSRQDALSLSVALIEFACPGERLRVATAAGRA